MVLTPDTSTDLVVALQKHTSKRNAIEYASMLEKLSIRSTYDVIRISKSRGGLANLDTNPHLKSLLRRVSGDDPGLFEYTPLEAYFGNDIFSAKGNIIFIPAVAILLSLAGSNGTFFDLFERVVVLSLICVFLLILLIRSFMLLFREETIGHVEIRKNEKGYTATITQINGGLKSSPLVVEGVGTDIGFYFFEILLSPLVTFVGIQSSICWAAVVDINGESHKQLVELSHVPLSTWRVLETLPFIPGVRSIQRSIVVKTTHECVKYRVNKNSLGQIFTTTM